MNPYFPAIQMNSTEKFRYQHTFRLRGGEVEEPTQSTGDSFTERQEFEKAWLLYTKLSRLNGEVSSLVKGAASLDQVREPKPSIEANSSTQEVGASETPVWGRDEIPLSGQVQLHKENHLGIAGYLYFDPEKLEAGIGEYGALASGSLRSGELLKWTEEKMGRQIRVREQSKGSGLFGYKETELLIQNRRAGLAPRSGLMGGAFRGTPPEVTATDKIVVNHKSDTITLLANSLE